jgi:hypothetical protein
MDTKATDSTVATIGIDIGENSFHLRPDIEAGQQLPENALHARCPRRADATGKLAADVAAAARPRGNMVTTMHPITKGRPAPALFVCCLLPQRGGGNACRKEHWLP